MYARELGGKAGMDKIYVTNGCSSHSEKDRQDEDYYATEPKMITLLLEQEKFTPTVWECAVGGGHMARALEEGGYKVIGSDIIDRGYPNTVICDFLNYTCEKPVSTDIITNPPYKYAEQFVRKALEVIREGGKVAMFLKLTFLEGKGRKEMFEKQPPKVVYVSSSRANCAMNGEFEKYPSSAIAYAWYVWEKGYKGDTIIKWIN